MANIFQQGMGAFDDANKRQQGFTEQRARVNAGRAQGAGDFAGAAQAFGAAGLTDDARQAVADTQVIADRKAAASNLEEDRQQKAAQHKLEVLGKVTEAIGSVPEGQRRPALDQLTPIFEKLGMDAGPFTGLDETHLTDAALAPWKAALTKAQTDYTLTPGAKRFDGQNREVASVEAEQKFVPVPEGGKLVPVPRLGAPLPAQAATSAPTPRSPHDTVQPLTALGATVTSSYRTPAHNAEVGGAPNSRHLTNQAVDLVPPPNMTLAQLGEEARRVVPGSKVIVEKDHVHVQWGAAPAAPASRDGDPAGTIYGNPKRKEPPAGYTYKADGSLMFIPGGPADPNTQTSTGRNARKAAADLRKEFNQRPEIKEYRDVQTSYRQIENLASKPPTAAGDLSLIFSYMKMLDPGSVVREGEFATAQNAAGIPDQIRNLWNKSLNGQRLNPNQRAQFLQTAKSIYETRQRRYGEVSKEYRGYAEDYDIDPNQIDRPAALRSDPSAIVAARAAIAKGAKKADVIKRLADNGINSAGL